MNLLDSIFQRRVNPTASRYSQPRAIEVSYPDGKEAIAIDPDKLSLKYPDRPPAIFTNG